MDKTLISKTAGFYPVGNDLVCDYVIGGVLTRMRSVKDIGDSHECVRWERPNKKPRGIGIVRNRDGYIRVGDHVSTLPKNQLLELVELIISDGRITAESFPNIDKRIEKWQSLI